MCCHICRAGVGTAEELSSILDHRGQGGHEEVGVGCQGKVLLDQFFYRVYRESVVWLGLKGSR